MAQAKEFEIAFKLGAELTSSFKGAFKEAQKSMKGLENAGKAMTGLGKKMTMAVTAPIVGAGVAAVNFAKDQEAAFAQTSTLLDESKTNFDEYKNDIRALSSEMGIAFEDVAESVYSSISAGQDQADAIEFTRKATMLAAGGFTSASNAVDVLTTSLNAYGLESSETERLSDILITTQNLGKTTVDELSQSMGKVIPIAQAQGVSFDQLSTGYAVLTKNGIATAEAGTMMKAMFSELGKSGTEVDKILRDQTGKSFSELQESGMNVGEVLGILQEEADKSGTKLSDMFGSVLAGSAALTLAKDGSGEFQEFLGEMENSAGATKQAFEIMEDTVETRIAVAKETLKNAMAMIGDNLLPLVAKGAEVVAKFADKFSKITPEAQRNIIAIAGVAAAIGPLLMIAGTFIIQGVKLASAIKAISIAMKGLNITMLANPVFLIIAGILALGAALVVAYAKIDWFREAVNTAFNWIKEVFMGAFGWMLDVLPVVIENIKIVLDGLLEKFTVVFNWIANIVSVVFSDAMEIAMSVVDRFKELWAEHGEFIMMIVQDAFARIVAQIQLAMGIIKGIFEIVWPIISNIIQIAWSYIQMIVKNGIALVTGIIDVAMNLLKGNWQGAWDAIKSTAQTIMNNIIGFFKGIDLYAVGKSIIDGLIRGIKSMGSAVISSISSIVPAPLRGAVQKVVGAIPGFATGGIVHDPTLAWVGEGGDSEAIIPFNNSARSRGLWFEAGKALGMFGGNYDDQPSMGDFDFDGFGGGGRQGGRSGDTYVYFNPSYEINGGNQTEVVETIEESNNDLRDELERIKKDEERRAL